MTDAKLWGGMCAQSVRILPPAESAALREAYLNAFVDRSSDHYRQYVENRIRFSDGEHYTGYLWDNLRSGVRITSQRFAHEIVRYPEVRVMADDHSRNRVISAPLWPYPPYSVVVLPPNLLLELLPAFPEDIYVFDSTVSWTLIRTHEHDAKRRICLAVGFNA